LLIVLQQKNVVIIERKETFLIIMKYEFYGEPQQRSVLFVNRKNEQLRFQLTCPESNFARLQKVFLATHFSWQNSHRKIRKLLCAPTGKVLMTNCRPIPLSIAATVPERSLGEFLPYRSRRVKLCSALAGAKKNCDFGGLMP
jgi:hypothetical protein